MSDKVLEAIQGIKTDLGTFADRAKEVQAAVDKRLDQQDTRLTELETNIKAALGDKYGKGEDVPKKEWGWARFAYAVAHKDWSVAPFEHEQVQRHRDMISKTMQASAFGAGGSMIPPQYVGELIELLRPQLILTRLGVRTLTGLTGSPVMIPKIVTGTSATWMAPEGTAATATELKTGRLDLTPHKLGALVKLSNDLVMLSNPSVEAGVRADLVSALSEAIDTAAFQGTGVQGQPLGLKNWLPALTTDDFTATNASTVLIDLTAAIKTVENAHALNGNLAWAVNPTSYWKLASIVDGGTTGRPILQPYSASSFGADMMDRLIGYPIQRSTLVSPAGTDDGYFGNWNDMILGIWSSVSIAASTDADTAFAADELWIRAIAHVDMGIRHEASFYSLTAIH